MDTLGAIEEGLRHELGGDERCRPLIEKLDLDEALELGRRAGRAAVASLLLRQMLGEDRFDTSDAALMLQVTRQALHKRAKAGSLLGLPGRGTTWYPAWQFDVDNRMLRPAALASFTAWIDVLGQTFDRMTLLAWANSPQPELANETPAAWIRNDEEAEPVIDSARRAARSLAS